MTFVYQEYLMLNSDIKHTIGLILDRTGRECSEMTKVL